MVPPRFGQCTAGSRLALQASQRCCQVVKLNDRPALLEVAVRISQRPSPRRSWCVREPSASPGWPVSLLVTSYDKQRILMRNSVRPPHQAVLLVTVVCEGIPGQGELERAPPFPSLSPYALIRGTLSARPSILDGGCALTHKVLRPLSLP